MVIDTILVNSAPKREVEMNVEIICPHCGAEHDVDELLIGRKVVCSKVNCKQKFLAELPPKAPPRVETAADKRGWEWPKAPPVAKYSKEDMERDAASEKTIDRIRLGIWIAAAIILGPIILFAVLGPVFFPIK